MFSSNDAKVWNLFGFNFDLRYICIGIYANDVNSTHNEN